MHYNEWLYQPPNPSLPSMQIIHPFLASRSSANHEKWLGMGNVSNRGILILVNVPLL